MASKDNQAPQRGKQTEKDRIQQKEEELSLRNFPRHEV